MSPALPGVLGALALLAQDPLAARTDGYPVRHDALHYDIAVALPATGGRVALDVGARWVVDGPDPIRLDLDTAMTVTRAEVNGRAVPWRREGGWLLLAHGGAAGDTVLTAVRYAGVPRDGLVIRGEGTGRTVFADNWPDRARHWLAAQNHPSDKATVAWHVDAPLGLAVVANGTLAGVDSTRDRATWRFVMTEPTPVHTMVLGAGRLVPVPLPDGGCAVHCVPQTAWSTPADSAWTATSAFTRAGEMVDLFTRLFGAFPYSELRHVQAATMFGGMENSTVIFYGERIWAEGRVSEGLVAHETAHQWFGDAVNQADWHHLWLSEGFASYAAVLWQEHRDGPAGLRRAMEGVARAARQGRSRDRPILDSAPGGLMALLNSNNYQKGAAVLHALRGLVGDDAFFRGLRWYADRYLHQSVLSRDFADTMAEASGRDLEWFFRQALTQPGHPVLEVWTRPAGDSVTVEITQVQDPAWGLFRIPALALAIDGTRVTMDVEGGVSRATFPGGPPGGPPSRVEVDPDGWWLLEVRTPLP